MIVDQLALCAADGAFHGMELLRQINTLTMRSNMDGTAAR
jgi:hypothetical protein